MKKQIFFLILFLITVVTITAQNVPSVIHQKDSVFMSKDYPYILPIMGDKAHKAGIRLPFPVGIMFNSMAVNQKLGISDLKLGFGNINSSDPPNMINLDEIVEFDEISAQTSTYNVRIDAWILPFLNVYGLAGVTRKADINVSLLNPIPLSVNTEVSGTYFGYGVAAAGGLGPVFVSADVSQAFNFNPRLDKPVKLLLTGVRTGPIFRFKNNPHMNITLWIGAMYGHFDGHTSGEIRTVDLAPDAPGKVDEMQGNLDSWYNGLSPIDQIKYHGAYNRLSDGLTSLKTGINDSYLRYEMTKTVSSPWNMSVGGQWQINHRWQIRAESQFLGDRTSGLISLNYRFGVRGKNWFAYQNY